MHLAQVFTMNPLYGCLWGVLLFSTTVSHAAPNPNPGDCKCRPHLPCWPSEPEWQQLNSSIEGNLISHIRPVAGACYKGTAEYDEDRCAEVAAKYTDSFWRADQAGDVQFINCETYPPKKESCYLPSLVTTSPNSTECKQGNIPQYAVRARNPKDISAAVKFAAKHKLPTVVKNSGHDFLCRSARRNALMIWTHFMNDISFLNEHGKWFPSGCEAEKYRESELLVKVTSGVNLHDLYQAVAQKGRLVVAGSATTVGVAGGYVQGGGHSLLSPYKGMGCDNAVEFELVTADGSILNASPCENPDLFWALRGGGGSTFGVVTSVTLRTFPDAMTPLYTFNASILPSVGYVDDANATMWELVSRWHALAPAVKDLGGSGYYFMFINYFGIKLNFFSSTIFFVGHTDVKEIEDLFAPLTAWAYENIGGPETGLVNSTIEDPFSISAFLGEGYFGSIPTGLNSLLGSRLLSRELLSTPEGVNRTTAAIAELSALGGGTFLGNYVTPPDNQMVDNAVHPAWRKAISHFMVFLDWDNSDSFEEQDRIQKLLTHKMVPEFKALDWDEKTQKQTMGAYLNEADKEEEDWQDSFWGENYGRLSQIKKKWDPNGVFWCRPCVGSEEWDREGICRKSK